MNRAEMLGRAIARREPWDMVIIGGGAVGTGVAVDAASRGYEVLLVEQHDFGKGTSSRSRFSRPTCSTPCRPTPAFGSLNFASTEGRRATTS